MTNVILAPHLDDAVFNCWHILKQPNALAITVFADTPPEGTRSIWDRFYGEPDSVVMMKRRIKENKAVLDTTNTKSINLAFFDFQYRHDKRNLEAIADAILAKAPRDAIFYAPASSSKVWRHPDHVTMRKVGILLMKRGKKVIFYADVPYMVMPRKVRASYLKRISRTASKLLKADVIAEAIELDKKDQVLKRQAMKKYGSQYKMSNVSSFGRLGLKSNHEREIIFNIV